MPNKFVCPKCGGELTMYIRENTEEKYTIDPVTGAATRVRYEVEGSQYVVQCCHCHKFQDYDEEVFAICGEDDGITGIEHVEPKICPVCEESAARHGVYPSYCDHCGAVR